MSSSKKDLLHKTFYSCVDYHVAISDHLLSNISKIIPMSEKSIALKIYVSTDFIYPVSRETCEPKIVHVGRIVKGKGQLDLANATLNKDIPVTFIGVGEQVIVDEINKMALFNNRKEQYLFLGFVDDVQSVLRHYSIFVLPSAGEGLSNALIEALGNGLICVVYDNTVFPEFKKMGFNIHVVRNADVSALGDEISLVLANFDEEYKLAQENVALARRLFSKKAEVDAYLKL